MGEEEKYNFYRNHDWNELVYQSVGDIIENHNNRVSFCFFAVVVVEIDDDDSVAVSI